MHVASGYCRGKSPVGAAHRADDGAAVIAAAARVDACRWWASHVRSPAAGSRLAASDYFTTDPQVMVASVPMQGVRTIDATIGDMFAWLSLAGLTMLIGVVVTERRRMQ